MSTTVEEIRAASYVGFDSITRQIEHKLLKRGFQFNVIVVGVWCSSTIVIPCKHPFLGQTGLGKSTLINTIFASHLIDSKGRLESDEPVRQTTEIQAVSHGIYRFIHICSHNRLFDPSRYKVIAENGVKLRLNIVDTPGYGDQVNNENWWGRQFLHSHSSSSVFFSWDPIVKYIKVFFVVFIWSEPVELIHFRINTAHISGRNSLRSAIATFRTHASIALCFSSILLATLSVLLTWSSWRNSAK